MALGAIYAWRDLGVALALIGGAALRSAFGGIEQPFLLFGLSYGVCVILSLYLARTREL